MRFGLLCRSADKIQVPKSWSNHLLSEAHLKLLLECGSSGMVADRKLPCKFHSGGLVNRFRAWSIVQILLQKLRDVDNNSLPMPAHCAPWPLKTNAIPDLVARDFSKSDTVPSWSIIANARCFIWSLLVPRVYARSSTLTEL